MPKPLDTEAKAFGFLKVKNLYLLVVTFVMSIAAIPMLAHPFGLKGAFALTGGTTLFEVFYFALSNNLPDHFILNWIRYNLEPQFYIPGRERPEGNPRP